MKQLLVPTFLLLALCADSRAADTFVTADARVADMNWLIEQIGSRYAYLPERHLDFKSLRAIYEPKARAARTREAWVHVVERLTAELHDNHVTLGTNTPSSPQLIPTGTDLWAEKKNGRFVILEVRPQSPAATEGLTAGDLILRIGGVPVAEAIEFSRPKAVNSPDAEAVNFTLRALLAGTHDSTRRIVVQDVTGKNREISLAPFVPTNSDELVSSRWLDDATGYIRFENSLGDSETVAAFDEALSKLGNASYLVLDLRDTPSGGNTDVAEPIMGRFISEPAAYQLVFEPGAGKRNPQDAWLKSVAPRGLPVTAKLVVLVDHWTGSMGEGMAIGLDALRRAQIVGTPMAGLCGGTERFELPNTKIPVNLPTYRLYHVNGTPREAFVPPVNVDLTKRSQGTNDPILARGMQVLREE